jgi:hypothetical protein
MPMDIYHISGLISIITNVLALAIGVFYCYRSHNPPYMRIFPAYLFVSVAAEFLGNDDILKLFNYQPFGSHQLYGTIATYNLYTPFELFIFAWFLFQIIQSSRIKKLLILLLMLFCLFFIIYSIKLDIGENTNIVAVFLECVIIIIPCLTWYRELFTRNESVNLFREPAFWLVTGIFFYLATIIPYLVTSTYLTNHGLYRLVKTFASINNFSLVITYILFIKGFTCRIRRS